MDAHDRAGMTYVADAVVIDLAANAIHLRVPDFPVAGEQVRKATLDVGGNGRLVGLEIDEDYISVMDLPDEPEPYTRSAEVEISISRETTPAIAIPRRGAGYEITYPSGNECWQMKSVGGTLIQVCATIAGARGALHDAHARRSGDHQRMP